MIPSDLTQIPVEELARLLMAYARQEPEHPARVPANSNEPPPGWVAPPAAQPCRAAFPRPVVEEPRFAGQDRLEDLVATAVTVAQEAEDAAEATRRASRRASRGAAIAMVLGALGAVAGISAGLSGLREAAPPPVMQSASAAVPVQSPAADIATVGGRSDTATSSPYAAARSAPMRLPVLAPATYVRVVPEVAAPPFATQPFGGRRG